VVQSPSNLVELKNGKRGRFWNVYMNSSNSIYSCNIFKFKNISIIDTYLSFSIETLKKCERILYFSLYFSSSKILPSHFLQIGKQNLR
jgi:hypothetical protein